MAELSIVIWFEADSLGKAGIWGLSEIEDPLEEALLDSGLGEVSGSGSGTRGSDIAVDIHDDRDFDKALALIRRVLKEANAPETTTIIRYGPPEDDEPAETGAIRKRTTYTL